MNKNKLFVIINIFAIFLFSFITHNLYTWVPSFITSIFPVNESLYEHLKLIFITPIIVSSILYIIFQYRGIKVNNYFGSLFVSSIANILIFYIPYLPIYDAIGENMIVTLILYFVSIGLSQFINYYFITKDHSKLFNIVGILMIIIVIGILWYFTYNPVICEFFLDPINHFYGIRQ